MRRNARFVQNPNGHTVLLPGQKPLTWEDLYIHFFGHFFTLALANRRVKKSKAKPKKGFGPVYSKLSFHKERASLKGPRVKVVYDAWMGSLFVDRYTGPDGWKLPRGFVMECYMTPFWEGCKGIAMSLIVYEKKNDRVDLVDVIRDLKFMPAMPGTNPESDRKKAEITMRRYFDVVTRALDRELPKIKRAIAASSR